MNSEIKTIDLGFVNVFLIKTGDGFVLVDTGVAQKLPLLEDELIQAGCLPDKLKLVIITHGDFDHTGNCAQLQQKYNAKIAMHDGDVEMVRTGVLVERKIHGIIGRLVMWIGKREIGEFDRFQPDILLQDGEVISMYGLTMKIIHTPGHTKGSICILTDGGQLFVGDMLANRIKPGFPPFIENEEKLHKSLEVLKRLDAVMVYPGHGRPFPFKTLLSVNDRFHRKGAEDAKK
jgi:hydroxyacylglutathione hydrolase